MHSRLLRRNNRGKSAGENTPTKKDWEHLQRVWGRQTTREGMDMSPDQLQLEADRKLKERITEALRYTPDMVEDFLQRMQKRLEQANADLNKTSADKHKQRALQLKNSYERTITRTRNAMENLKRSLSKQDREALQNLLEWARENHKTPRHQPNHHQPKRPQATPTTKSRPQVKCANCGREFDKVGMKIYCSFTCVQEAGREMSGGATPANTPTNKPTDAANA